MRLFGREKKPQALSVIIVGAGQVGYNIAERLSAENKRVTVIDTDAVALRRVSEAMDVQTIQGSGSSPRVLDQAGAAEADIILAVTDSDEINLIACFFANVLNGESLKLARIRNEEYTLYRDALSKEFLNIGMVINPEVEVVKTIDRLTSVPGALEYNEFADGMLKMIGLRVGESAITDVRLMELRREVARRVDGVEFIVAAIVREERLIVPSGQDVIKPGDLVYFVCQDKDVQPLLNICGCGAPPVSSVLIIGGGNIGFRLAQLCESKGYRTKLVDNNPERCAELAEKLSHTIVLMGDGTDQDFLQEENVQNMDAVVSLTGDEETNILSSLLAKSMGAKRTITRINKFAYQPLVRAIGIEHSVSPRLSAINSILHYVRRGKVISSVSIKGEEAEVMEAIAQEHSELVGKPVKDLDFPKGALLLAIMRGDTVLIPTGDSVILDEDRILILSTRKTIDRVEEALEVKLKHV